MSRMRQCLLVATATLLLAAGCGGNEGPDVTTGVGGFDGERAFEDVRRQVELGPRPSGSMANDQLIDLLVAELEGAGVESVRVQAPLHNVVGVIPGTEPGHVVLGAHHDTKDIPGFLGANDGASGVAVVLELARSLPRPLPGPSIAIALFDGEEARGDREFSVDGKRGSTQYVELAADGGAQGTPPIEEIEAMVLFDLVGDCDLGIPYEPNSDLDLYERFAETDGDVFAGDRGPIDDDHVPFVERGIPAVDLIDFDFGPGPSPGEFWHTNEDTLDKVCPESLDAVGEVALTVLPDIR